MKLQNQILLINRFFWSQLKIQELVSTPDISPVPSPHPLNHLNMQEIPFFHPQKVCCIFMSNFAVCWKRPRSCTCQSGWSASLAAGKRSSCCTSRTSLWASRPRRVSSRAKSASGWCSVCCRCCVRQRATRWQDSDSSRAKPLVIDNTRNYFALSNGRLPVSCDSIRVEQSR